MRVVCCDGARAILVSSESPMSLGHEYHDEYKNDPASGEIVGGWCFVPWAGAGSRCTRAENMLPLCRADGRSRRRFHPAIESRLAIRPLHSPSHHHHITRKDNMLAVILSTHNANAKVRSVASNTTSSFTLADLHRASGNTTASKCHWSR